MRRWRRVWKVEEDVRRCEEGVLESVGEEGVSWRKDLGL